MCCATVCAGCSACTNALTGKDDGVCAPGASGKDPHEACADETTTKPCGNDGTCDGEGACRKVGAGQKCGQASCDADGNTFTAEPKCDGNGACAPGASQACAPYPGTRTLEFACRCWDAGVCHAVTLNGRTARSNDATLRMLCLDSVTYCGLSGQPTACP